MAIFPQRFADRILGAAIHVHRQLGPGFLEKMHENALCLEFTKRRLPLTRQVPVRVSYDGSEIGMHRLAVIVDGCVVVEIKAVKDTEDVHLATVLSYLKATSLEAGLILNYAAAKLRIRRVVRTANWTAEARSGGKRRGRV